MVDDVSKFDGQVNDLIDDRLRIVAAKSVSTIGTCGGFVIDDFVGREDGALGFGVSVLPTAFASGRGSRGSRFNVEPIGRRRFGGVGGILVDSSLEIENQLRLLVESRFQRTKIDLNCGWQQVEKFGG